MPMLDAYIPVGALDPQAERTLLATLTDILIRGEGADPCNPAVRAMAWVTVLRPEVVFVAGARAERPRYRLVAGVPEGQWDDERRARMVAEVTDAVLDAEEGRHPREPARVWVLLPEVPEGTWGGGGRIWRLADVAGLALGDTEAGKRYADAVLAKRRAEPVAV